jgi:DNA-directed RNA polymerase subunit K/omega
MAATTNSKIFEDFDDIINDYKENLKKKKNITKPILSKYEKTKIIGMRMEQLARSATPYIDIKNMKTYDPFRIAMEELHSRKLPFMICRTLPNGKKEYWRLDDMMII